MSTQKIDLRGKTVFYWTFLEHVSNGDWKVRCECGTEKVVHGTNIKRGKSKSCGCHKGELLVASKGTHGLSNKKPYYIWRNMLNRCYDKGTDSYHLYGARGIIVCDRWRHSFYNFWGDIGGEYKKGLSIDRIDANGNYCPENCRWATSKEQGINKRNTKKISYNGKTKPLKIWSKELNMNYYSLQTRLRAGWSIKDTFTKPIMKYSS